MLGATQAEEIAFLDREVVPRRGELYKRCARSPSPTNRRLLDSEGEFADARRGATRGLLAMLAFGGLLSFSGGAPQPAPRL